MINPVLFFCFISLPSTGILHVTESASNPSGREEADFETILKHLDAVYSGRIAHEFMHLPVSKSPSLPQAT